MVEQVFCIPGTMCDENIWSWMLDASASPQVFKHVAIPQYSQIEQIIEHFAESLPKQNIHLLGFSLGGYLASLFASKYPERIAKLCVTSNSPCALPDDEVLARKESISWIKQVGYRGLPDGKIRMLLHEENAENQAIYGCIKGMEKRLGTDVFLQQLEATTQRSDLHTAFTDFSFPVTFCYGESDCLVNQQWIEDALDVNPLSSKIVVPGAGHMLPLEQPARLADILDRWV